MWHGLDPELSRQLAGIRDMVSRQRQTPTREWPWIVDDAAREVLVVREWPDGAITAYLMPLPSGK
jgi:hypothetical protein